MYRLNLPDRISDIATVERPFHATRLRQLVLASITSAATLLPACAPRRPSIHQDLAIPSCADNAGWAENMPNTVVSEYFSDVLYNDPDDKHLMPMPNEKAFPTRLPVESIDKITESIASEVKEAGRSMQAALQLHKGDPTAIRLIADKYYQRIGDVIAIHLATVPGYTFGKTPCRGNILPRMHALTQTLMFNKLLKRHDLPLNRIFPYTHCFEGIQLHLFLALPASKRASAFVDFSAGVDHSVMPHEGIIRAQILNALPAITDAFHTAYPDIGKHLLPLTNFKYEEYQMPSNKFPLKGTIKHGVLIAHTPVQASQDAIHTTVVHEYFHLMFQKALEERYTQWHEEEDYSVVPTFYSSFVPYRLTTYHVHEAIANFGEFFFARPLKRVQDIKEFFQIMMMTSLTYSLPGDLVHAAAEETLNMPVDREQYRAEEKYRNAVDTALLQRLEGLERAYARKLTLILEEFAAATPTLIPLQDLQEQCSVE